MPKGYVIASVTVTDPKKYAQYAKASAVACARAGGRALVKGGQCAILEGDGRTRNVILEFDDFETAKAYYDTEAYRQARQLRLGAAEVSIVAVEGA